MKKEKEKRGKGLIKRREINKEREIERRKLKRELK
jgi:hypothetical protein